MTKSGKKSKNRFMKNARSWRSYLSKGLTIAADILPKIPKRRDPLLQKTVAILSIFHSVQKAFIPEHVKNPLRSMIDSMGLVEANNEQFVRLFFDTELFKRFNVDKFAISDYTDVHLMEDDKLGTLLFVETSWSKGPLPTFHHSSDVDFAEILRGVWELYNNHIHLTVGNEDGCNKSEFTTFADIGNPLYGSAAKQIDEMIVRHKRFTENNVPRSYMFYGQPGTGKSSAAMVFAGRLGRRILKVDANSLATAHVKTLSFLIEYLRPDFLIIDDVDKINAEKGLPTLLDVLQRFKTEHSFASVIMTANSITSFDKGFLRPGRIDTWIEFAMPNSEERKAILENYLKEAGVVLADDEIAKVVEMTDGLSQDYLREIVTCFKHDKSDDVAKSIELMKSLLGIKKVETAAKTTLADAAAKFAELAASRGASLTELAAKNASIADEIKSLKDEAEGKQ